MRRFLHLLLIPLLAFTTVTASRAQDATSPLLGLLLMGPGLHPNDWGVQTNSNLTKLENSIAGRTDITLGASDYTLSADEARSAYIVLAGTLSNNVNLIVPAKAKTWMIWNNTTGFNVTVKLAAGGGTQVLTPGSGGNIYWTDGTTGVFMTPNISAINTSLAGMMPKSGGVFTGSVTFGAAGSAMPNGAPYYLGSAGALIYGDANYAVVRGGASGFVFQRSSDFASLITVNNTGNLFAAATVNDVMGNLRDLPQAFPGGTYVNIDSTYAGKAIVTSAGIGILPNQLGANNVVSVVNFSDGSIPINIGSGMNMFLAGVAASNASRTLMPRGIATIYFLSGVTAYIAGNVQ